MSELARALYELAMKSWASLTYPERALFSAWLETGVCLSCGGRFVCVQCGTSEVPDRRAMDLYLLIRGAMERAVRGKTSASPVLASVLNHRADPKADPDTVETIPAPPDDDDEPDGAA